MAKSFFKTVFAFIIIFCAPFFAPAQSGAERNFEVELLNFSIGMESPFISTSDLIKQTYDFITDGSLFSFNNFGLDEMFSANTQLFLQPVKITVRSKTKTKYEFWTNIDSKVYVKISEGAINAAQEILKNKDDPSNIDINAMNGSVGIAGYFFVEAGFAVSKTLVDKKFWARVAPQVFIPLFYIKQHEINLSGYTSGTGNGFMGIKGSGEIALYSPLDLQAPDYSALTRTAGIDITLNMLWNLLPWLDAGADILHIPFVPANLLRRYSAALDIDICVPDPAYPWTQQQIADMDMNKISTKYNLNFSIAEPVNYYCMRPLRFDFFALYKPLRENLLIIRPGLGFSVNTVVGMWLPDYSFSVQLNLPVVVSLETGTELFESVFRHYFSAVFNFKVFELSGAFFLQGQEFISSWNGSGSGARIALRIGY
ncbi:MAG: hypothetical protein Pg6A_07560 [Termitinemataceae bacterium]|nr:MAG: hypothetical protein Pg6A_07560 [Termitinemataceae bacterium]